MADPVEDFFASADAPPSAPRGPQGGDAANDPVHAFLSSGGSGLAPESHAAPQKDVPQNAPRATGPLDSRRYLMGEAGKFAAHELTSLGSHIIGGAEGLYDLATGKGSRQAAQDVERQVAERTYNPDSATAAHQVQASESPYNPLNWPSLLSKAAGEGTFALTKSPLAATGVETAGNAATMLLGLRGGNKPFTPGEWTPAAGAQAQAAPGMPGAAAPSTPLAVAEDAGRQPVPGSVAPTLEAPEAPKFSEEVKAAPRAEAPGSPEVTARAQVLQKIGLDTARNSALYNDGPAGVSEFQTSRDPTTVQGLEADQVFKRERGALQDFAQRIVQKTGGTAGTDGATLEARGNTILEPFDKLGDYYDEKIRGLYDTASERAKGQPVALNRFAAELRDASNITDPAHVTLKPAVEAFAKKTGLMDADGSIVGNVQQAETLRKYLGRTFTHQNSTFVRTLKDALDEDVTSYAGEDVYKQARALFAEKKATLENPNGIGKLLDSSGPQGINRKVPAEKIGDYLLSMPQAQLKHVVSTLEQAPPEIRPQADAALAELRAHVASRISDAGNSTQTMWNQKAVTKLLNNQSGKLPIIFGGDAAPLLSDFKTLNDAGNILRVDRSYPGAAIQGSILKSKLLPNAMTTAGAAAGGATGAVFGAPGFGAAAGGAAGAALGAKMQTSAALKALRARQTSLSEILKSTPP